MIKLDSCSLIYVIKADLLPLVSKLYKGVRITDSVYREVVVNGKDAGYPDAMVTEAQVKRKKIEVIRFKGRKSPILVGIGDGESDTIAEAKKEGCPVLIDDIKAKIIARKLDVPYLSTDVMLLEALVKGKITLDEFNDMAQELNRICNMRSDRYMDLLAIAKIISEGGR